MLFLAGRIIPENSRRLGRDVAAPFPHAILAGMDVPGEIIAAIATGAGRAAVGIVRLSGPGSHALALRLCPGLRRPPPDRRLARCRVVHPVDGRALDDALVVFFREGASFTGEEAVEIHGHGGPAVLDGLLHACLDAGARPARAGRRTAGPRAARSSR